MTIEDLKSLKLDEMVWNDDGSIMKLASRWTDDTDFSKLKPDSSIFSNNYNDFRCFPKNSYSLKFNEINKWHKVKDGFGDNLKAHINYLHYEMICLYDKLKNARLNL